MEILLEKVGVINFKYEKLNARDNFNVFSILFKSSDEVFLHSRFIAELLDPAGSHGQNALFTKLFLETIDVKGFRIEGVEVYREYANIDLLLINSTQAIIIENKIWAIDQDKQLQRYFDLITEKGYRDIHIFYLTVDGKDPSEQSLGMLKELNNVRTISYKYHIKKWLDKCTEASARLPTLRETLIQYQNLINELTGNTMGEEQKRELTELLSEGDNILKAYSIVENWNHIKFHAELNFWQELEKLIETQFHVLDDQKYSVQDLNSVIHQSRNGNYFYGLMFEIGKYNGESICMFIERGWLTVYYGLTVLKDGDRSITDEPQFDDLVEKISPFLEGEREEAWLRWNFLKTEINLHTFSDKDTLLLCNPGQRKRIVFQCWEEIKGVVEKCQSVLG